MSWESENKVRAAGTTSNYFKIIQPRPWGDAVDERVPHKRPSLMQRNKSKIFALNHLISMLTFGRSPSGRRPLFAVGLRELLKNYMTCPSTGGARSATVRASIAAQNFERFEDPGHNKHLIMEDVLKPFEEDPRIERKFSSDRNWSLVGVAVLWALYAFIFYEMRDYAGSGDVMLALAISGGLVLLFNTVSIFALISQLNARRKEIYGLDLHYLDLQKKKP